MKKIITAFVLVLMFSAVYAGTNSGFYIGAGGGYSTLDMGEEGETRYNDAAITEDIIFPATEGGMGFYIRMGIHDTEQGTLDLGYERTVHAGTYCGGSYETYYNDINLGGRWTFIDIANLARPFLLLDLNVQWLTVSGGAIGSGYTGDSTFTGFGMSAGGGVIVPLIKTLFINIDAMWRFNLYMSASGRDVSGELDSYLFRHGLTFRAGLNYVLPE